MAELSLPDELVFWIYELWSVRRYELKKLFGKHVSKQQMLNIYSFQKYYKLK